METDFKENIVDAKIITGIPNDRLHLSLKNEENDVFSVVVDIDEDDWKGFSLNGKEYDLNIFLPEDEENYQLSVYGVDENGKIDINDIYLEGYEVPYFNNAK